jgi:beta-glucosidase
MIARMSLDDKLTLIGGEDDFFTRAVPSIELKRLKMSDGPVGVRCFGPSTAYTASVALAASWDPDLAQRVGASLGDDARARGVNFLLGPGVNIYRSPLNGRNMEYLGEDPYLAGRIAVGYIDGVQSKGVSATVKHFAANNSEFDRAQINAVIDERTLREIYLPAFEAAVKQSHVGAVMDSYNLVNGEHSTQNSHLNKDILKAEWGFQGVLMSDWVAVHDGVAAANGGLDLEMPSAQYMTQDALKAALKDGRLRQSAIDDKVRRILRTAVEFGWLSRDQTDTTIPLYNLAADRVALDEALESITLLKNENNLLPLDSKRIKTIALIGPEAASPVTGGGGSSYTTPFEAQSFVAGFASYLGGRAKVMYAQGLPPLDTIVRRTDFRNLTMETRVGSKEARPAVQRDLRQINLWPGNGQRSWPQTQIDTYYHWTGEYIPSISGEYLLVVTTTDPDAYRLVMNGKEVLAHRPGVTRQAVGTATLSLTAGQPATLDIEYNTRSAAPHIGVGLQLKSDLLPPESQRIVRQADAVLIAAGFDGSTEGEGSDRPYAMPLLQNDLISVVAALNPKTIVTITAGGAIETEPWIANVPALLHNYYPGQQGARALAEIVFGDHSPEGHLPFSWDRVLEENPTTSHYPEEPGGRDSHYAEGLFLGYRYYTSTQKKPLFPFGFGLSYTTFSYSRLIVKRNSPDDVEVTFDLQNVGLREGAAVAQVYVGDPSATVKRPAMELKQLAKIRLKAGAMRNVVLHLDRRAFEYYDVEGEKWKLDPGVFTIFVGESSSEVELQKNLTMM